MAINVAFSTISTSQEIMYCATYICIQASLFIVWGFSSEVCFKYPFLCVLSTRFWSVLSTRTDIRFFWPKFDYFGFSGANFST